MKLILDASAVAGWLMPDETSLNLHDLASQFDEFIAPWLLWPEFRNILIVSERRGRLPDGFADQAIEAVDALGIKMDSSPSSGRCCRTRSVEDSLRESMPLDGLHEQAISRPLSHDELVQLQRIAAKAWVFADPGRQGHELARAA